MTGADRHLGRGGKAEESASASGLRRAIGMMGILLKHGEPMRVAELATALSIPRSSAYVIIRELTGARYLARSDSGMFYLGPMLFELGMAYGSKIDLVKEGASIVKLLRDSTGETVQLCILDGGELLVLMKEEGSRPVHIISRVGSRVPVNWAAGGRLIVSDLGEQDLRRLLRDTVRPSPTGKASTDVEHLIRQVRKCRDKGYSIEIGETNEHAGCVAAPVHDATGRCVAAISIAVPEQRLKLPNRKWLIDAVRQAARTLSERVGASQIAH